MASEAACPGPQRFPGDGTHATADAYAPQSAITDHRGSNRAESTNSKYRQVSHYRSSVVSHDPRCGREVEPGFLVNIRIYPELHPNGEPEISLKAFDASLAVL
jgi:hypothetical protein